MAQTATIRRVVRTAIQLLAVAVVLSTALVGTAFGASVLAGGVVMLASFGVSALMARRVSAAVEKGHTSGASGATMIKLPVLMLVIWALFERFDVLGVVVGGSVMVAAVVIDAIRDADQPLVGAA